jgi:predicted RNA-binding Zn-ribbon protein involved in translation (DUF1610 family)
MSSQENLRTSDQFPCPACGGQMTYDPEAGTLCCAYCEKTLTIDKDSAEIQEYDLEEDLGEADQDWGQDTQVIRCQSCGAQTVLEAHSVSQNCSFCGSAHVVRIDEMAGIKPESLIPFKVARPKAEGLFTRWIGRKWLAPGSLKKEYSPEKLKGIYVPFWTYDTATHSTYTAKAYDDLLINAASHMQGRLIRKIEPFDLRELIPYRPEYLAGFGAERYSIGLQQGWGNAKDIIRQDLYGDIHGQIHADTVRNLNVQTMYRDVRYKHLLLPVWISAYRFHKKTYQFLINGQTGEVQGRAPVSFWKVSLLVLGGAALIALIYWLIQVFGGPSISY